MPDRENLRWTSPLRPPLAACACALLALACATVPRLGEAQISVVSTTTVMDWVRQFAALAGPGSSDMDYRVTGRLFLRDASAEYVDFESSGNLGGAAGLGGR